jgi:hypothetical protein
MHVSLLNSFCIGWGANEEFQNKIQNIPINLNDFDFFVNNLTIVTFDENLTLLYERGSGAKSPKNPWLWCSAKTRLAPAC